MIEKREKQFKKELEYLTKEELGKELSLNKNNIENTNIDLKTLAREIYAKRGLDVSKIKKGFLNSLVDELTKFSSLFYEKEKGTKGKMILEVVYIVILLVLLKIPFDLVRDIGLDYIMLMTTKTIYSNLWSFILLILYTITIICTFLVLIRNFNKKYSK